MSLGDVAYPLCIESAVEADTYLGGSNGAPGRRKQAGRVAAIDYTVGNRTLRQR